MDLKEDFPLNLIGKIDSTLFETLYIFWGTGPCSEFW